MARRTKPRQTGRVVAAPAPATAWIPWWAEAAARAALLTVIALMAFPVRYHAIGTGLDGSWAFALNWFAAHGFIHGRDVAFTYGPLGYLTLPMNVGGNLTRGILFQTGWWLVFVAATAWAVFARRIPAWRLALFAVLFAGGVRAFHDFGYAGPDMFIGFTALLLLGCALEGRWWWGFHAAAVITGAVLLLVKLSSGILALSAAVLFAAGLALTDRGRAWRAAAIAASAPLVFAAVYLGYNASVPDMARYVRAGIEISSGYTAALSEAGTEGLTAAVAIGAVYALLAAALWLTRQPSAALAIAGLGPLFLVFKHSFVRPSGHVEIYFRFVPLLVGLVLLFTRFDRRRWWVVAAPLALLALLWYPRSGWPEDYFRTGAMTALLRPGEMRTALAVQSAGGLAAQRLPAALVERIGKATVTVLPWEASYAAANPINYRPLPVFQIYAASTAYLDAWNAETVEDRGRAPAWVLLEWSAIDGRHPLLDMPATTLALYRHYDFDSVHGPRMLLRRRPAPRFAAPVFRETVHFRMGEPLHFEDRGRALIGRLHLTPSLAGAARRFLLRLPEVDAMLSSDDGLVVGARVPPDVLSGPVPLNFVPVNLEEARALFERNEAANYNALVLIGPGTSAYRAGISAELWEIPGLTLTRPPAATMPAGDYGTAEAGRIEVINGLGASDYGPNEVVEVPAPGYVQISGWAFDQPRGAPAPAVWIEVDGKSYPATHGLPRMDIASGFRNPALGASGFQWAFPAWKLGTGVHEVRLKVASADGKARYSTAQRLRVRLRPV